MEIRLAGVLSAEQCKVEELISSLAVHELYFLAESKFCVSSCKSDESFKSSDCDGCNSSLKVAGLKVKLTQLGPRLTDELIGLLSHH